MMIVMTTVAMMAVTMTLMMIKRAATWNLKIYDILLLIIVHVKFIIAVLLMLHIFSVYMYTICKLYMYEL